MKNQNIINYSPSEFAFGFEACNSCYYDKKINGIELKVRFPGIFSKMDNNNIIKILELKSIAIVGLSNKNHKPSYQIYKK